MPFIGGDIVNHSQTPSSWIHCPICGGKTRTKVYKDIVLVKFSHKGESKTLQQALSKGQEINTGRRIRSKPE